MNPILHHARDLTRRTLLGRGAAGLGAARVVLTEGGPDAAPLLDAYSATPEAAYVRTSLPAWMRGNCVLSAC